PIIVDASYGLIQSISTPKLSAGSLTWQETGTGMADLELARVNVTRKGTPDLNFVHVIVAPHAGTTLALPTLAGANAMYNPLATDLVTGIAGIAAVPSGYDGVRATMFSTSNILSAAPRGGSPATLSYASF